MSNLLRKKTMNQVRLLSILAVLQLVTFMSYAQTNVPLTHTISCTQGMTGTTSCVQGQTSSGWPATESVTNYWQYSLNAAGYSNIRMSYAQSSSSTGPCSGHRMYNIGAGDVNINTYSLSGSGCGGGTSCNSAAALGTTTLPNPCNNASSLLVRIRMWGASSGSGTDRITSATSGSAATSTGVFVGDCSTPTAYTVSGASSCTGSTITLSSSDGTWASYDLKNGSTTVQTLVGTGSALNFTSTTMGTYTILARNTTSGCTTNATMTGSVVISTTVPSITGNPANAVVCSGVDAAFTGVATGATSYKWQKSTTAGGAVFADIFTGQDGGIYGATFTTPTLTITAPTTSVNNYNYRLIAINTCGNSTPSTVGNLTVNTCSGNTITTTSATFGPYCNSTSNPVSVAYTSTGTFTGTFQAELSDASGSFASPTVIGTGVSPISAVLPSGITAGTHYRIRVTNPTPATIGSDNGADIIFNDPSIGGSVASVSQSICPGNTPPLPFTLSGNTGSVVEWQSSADNVFTTPVSIPSTVGLTSLPAATMGALSSTTYYRAVVKNGACASAISTISTVTVNPTPVIVVTPPGGDFCAGSSGLNMTASGANTYSWAPAAGLSATVGAGVIATPAATTTYTVTGTSSAGCPGTTTVTVNSYVTPGTITVTPSTTTGCIAGAVNPITASLGAAGPATASSGAITAAFSSGSPAAAPLSISTIPTGATITGVSVVFNVTQIGTGWNADDIIALKAPNGKILNLFNAKGGSSSTGGINNMEVNSTSTTAIPATGSPYTGGVYKADAALGVGAPGNLSNTTAWSDLFSTPNGSWQLLGHYTFASGSSQFTSWTITITYTLPSFTWSPATNLFTDVAGTLPYSGTLLNTVYENPLTSGAITYTVTAANGSCASSTTTTVTVNPLPTPIGGILSVCSGLTTALSDGTPGGVWSSNNTAVASVDASGVVTGGSAGTATIIYSNGCAPDATATVTVISGPAAISGPSSLCFSSSVTLSDAIGGGTWSSNNTTVADIDPVTGIITSGVAGAATINYSLGCGTDATTTITVIAAPAAIGGVSSLCVGSTSTLSESVTGGTWTSSNTGVATVNTTGVIGGVVAGIATINYTTGCGADVSRSVTVIAAPSAISGLSSVCSGLTIPLSNTVAGGTWSSSNSATASVDAAGVVTGGTAGTATINYTTGCGTDATKVITVISAPAAIGGVSSLCVGATSTLSESVTGGTWTSSNTGVATVNATGVIGGVVAGIATINYTTGCGTDVSRSVTVIAAPSAISGLSSVCSGLTIPLSNTVAGGTWSSSNSATASVDASGVVTGGTAGTATINYTTGCGTDATKVITVISAPAAIGGVSSLCVGSTSTLSESVTGGTWTSSNTGIATVNATGVIGGVVAGIATINYTTGCGTDVSHSVTVIAAPSAISGLSSVCSGLTIPLSNTVAGGTWSSSNSTTASVDASGVVTGGTAGTATINYTTGCGTDATKVITVISAPAAIGGVSTLCVGSTSTLSESVTGGTWTSSNTGVATVNATGLVGGVAGGIATINYTTGCGSAVSHSVTVITAPSSISGSSAVCSGLTISLSNTVTGGTWSSSNSTTASVNASGVVTGGTAGTATINYTTGCGTDATKVISVIAAPAAIGGVSSLCVGSTATLSESVTGGTWTSSNTGIATVNATGLVGGVAGGVATINYTTGCGSAVSHSVTVIAAPASITGPGAVCATQTILLMNFVSGGTWSSNNTSAASVSASGVVTGGTSGVATIRYSTGCGTDATKTVTVTAPPTPIGGVSVLCVGATSTFSESVTGGTWSTTNTNIATVNASGVIGGVAAGLAMFNYSTGCGTDVNKTIFIIDAPAAISGVSSLCSGLTATLSDAVANGTWSSSNTTVASVDAAGIVTAGIAGTATITYATGCGTDATKVITVITAPGSISGASSLCPGVVTTLSNTVAGGTWTSANTSIATINAAGSITGVAAGTTSIRYSTGCAPDAIMTFTVNPLPATPSAIIGATTLCNGTSVTLTDLTTGGIWSSDNTTVVTVGSTGSVFGVMAGTATVSYSVSNSCGTAAATALVTVEAPLSVLPSITGITTICEGTSGILSDAISGGVWTSANTSVAVILPSGDFTGVSGGNAEISYTVSNTCNTAFTTTTVTINSLPAPAPIIGAVTTFCAGSTIALSDPTPGGVWSSNLTSIATIDNSGVVTGALGGSTTIFYTMTNSCGNVSALLIVTVDPLPVLGNISGVTTMCVGATTMLSDTAAVGVWSSNNTFVATVGSNGKVTGITGGTAVISYSTSNSCGLFAATAVVTVNPLPFQGVITGIDSVCPGQTISLSNAVAGGVWSSDFPSTAIVTALGVVNGLTTGPDTIRYTVTNACGSSVAKKFIRVLPNSVCDPSGTNIITGISAELDLFPNPNDGSFIMKLTTGVNEDVHVIITNTVGVKVKEMTTSTNRDTPISLDSAPGIYFLTAVTQHDTKVIKFIIAE